MPDHNTPGLPDSDRNHGDSEAAANQARDVHGSLVQAGRIDRVVFVHQAPAVPEFQRLSNAVTPQPKDVLGPRGGSDLMAATPESSTGAAARVVSRITPGPTRLPKISQQVADGADEFTVADLVEFISSANALGLPDTTVFYCLRWKRNSIFCFWTTTFAWDDAQPSLEPMPVPPVTTDRRTTRVEVGQAATGPWASTWRWFRIRRARELLLGDLRTLLSRVAELGLAADRYVLHAQWVIGFAPQVHSVSVRPRPD